jgi:hypothetical protein
METSDIAAHVKNLRDLDKLVITNRIDQPIAWIGWKIALFFDNGETLERRLLANDVMRDFLATFGAYVTHYHPSDAERLKPIGDLDIAAYSDADARAKTAQSGRNGNDAYSADIYGFPGGIEAMRPAPFYFAISTAYRGLPKASHIEANFPLTWFPDGDLTPLIKLFQRWCELLKPAHGTLSPGLVFTQGSRSDSDFADTYSLVQRFPGLDYLDASRWKTASRTDRRKIRTIGWLTVIDSEFVTTLGGMGCVMTNLGPDIPIHPWSGGIVIQAGPEPRLGDRNRGIVPEPYRTVARVLRPLFFEAFRRGIFVPPPPLDAMRETQKWLHRFE